MLIDVIHNMDTEDLEKICNKFWEGKFQREEMELHIIAYIIQFYQLRSLSNVCRKRSHELINELKKFATVNARH
jgi:hypothetical protein